MEKHGKIKTKTYSIWGAIKQRCCNPRSAGYDRYGGRGITMCERWRKSFAAFLEDMGPCQSSEHSIDRYPNRHGNYEPGNCRWATWSEQLLNRSPWGKCYAIGGESKPIAVWMEERGIDYRHRTAIDNRLARGMSLEEALAKPFASGNGTTSRPWTRREEAVLRKNRWLPLDRLAKMLRRTKNGVSRKVFAMGLGKENTEERKRQAAELIEMVRPFWLAGETCAKIGARYGWSPERVWRIARSAGLPAHRRSIRTAELLFKLLENPTSIGLRVVELAEQLTILPWSVYKVFHHPEHGPRLARLYQKHGARLPIRKKFPADENGS